MLGSALVLVLGLSKEMEDVREAQLASFGDLWSE